MAVRGPRHSHVAVPQAMSPESALASDLFDQFVSAGTFKAALSTYRQICDLLQLAPSPLPLFYPRLKTKLRSWRAASLWTKLDKRASHKCYNRGKACSNVRVLIIGAGPCGLRAAIEAQLLGSKVVVLEKRDRYSRNNVLHLWPFVIHDLRNLGAKKFFGKFCAGSIDHISIRQLQLILLKVALLLGVEVHENVMFKDLLEPPEDQTKEKIGWRAQVLPADHPASQYEFDVLIGADGKRNTLKGFNRKEFRGKLAIAITANFMNRHTLEEARVPEISGVAFIFNQKFFQEMKENTAIDLENIVYYKDDTHYFVMTAKKQSLLEKGVIINDYSDTARLLSPENVDKGALMEYAREAADFATGYALPSLEFAVNHYGQADVAMFDFTSMYAAENACRLLERRSHWLLQGLVGDSLLEPFWPTGSGCARGFLSSLDAAWMIRSWANNRDSPLHVLAERESIYRLLAQTTPENLSKDLAEYSLSPSSRYPNLNLMAVLPSQVRSLCRTEVEIHLPPPAPRPLTEMQKKRRRRESIIHPDALLSWCQRQVALYAQVKIENMTTSWKDGLALCAILHRYRPDLVDLLELLPENSAANNQRAFDILEKEYGIPPVMTGLEMASCTVPDKLTMVSYLSQVYETFRGEIPHGRPVYKASKLLREKEVPPPPPLNLLGKITNKVQSRRKSSTERDTSRERDKSDSLKRSRVSLTRSRRSRVAAALSGNGSGDAGTAQYERILKALDKDSFTKRMQALQEQIRLDRKLARSERKSGHASSTTEDESCSSGPPGRIPRTAVQQLQEQLKFGGTTSPPKKKAIKVGRLGKDEWNVKMLEERLKQREKRQKEAKVHVEKPKVLKEIFDSKLQSMDARLKADGGLTDEERIRYSTIDDKLHKLGKQLREGSLDVGTRGQNRVAAMAGYIANVLDNQSGIREKRPAPPPPVVIAKNNANSIKTEQTTPLPPTLKPVVSQPEKVPSVEPSGVSEICCFCHKRVYLMERLSAEGLFFHRGCFRCDYCQGSLRLGNYAYDRAAPYKGKFYCAPHFRMERPSQRWQDMMRRKHAFLLAEPQPPSLVPPVSKAQDIQDGGCPTPAEVPRTPSPPLGAGEDMGDPSQLQKATTPFVEDGTAVTFQVKTYETPTRLSLDDMNAVIDVDNTPERVEFENSLELLSEDDLLTSELEEEELAQKNLGKVDVPTSDDECSDLSSEEDGSESESLVEEIEHSFTADETRHMAETWQRKHASSLEGNTCNDGQDEYHQGASSSSFEEEESSTEGEDDYEEDEETETETGEEDATSQDIDSDDEYSPHEPLSDEEGDVPEPEECGESGREEGVTVPVPVLKTEAPLDVEDGKSSEEYISDEEGLTMSSSEESSESEAAAPPPKHEIPTIVIDRSPGEQDLELDWGPKEVRAALGKSGGALESDGEADQHAGSSSPVVPPNEQCINHGAPTAEPSISPKSSDGQTSSDHLSLQINKLNKSAESLAGMSVSSGLSSSSNVDDLSEVKQAGREDLREDMASPSLTDVSEVSSLVDATPGSASPALTPAMETRGYGIMVDRVGSSESSCAQSPPEDQIGTSTASDSSAVPFGALRVQSASSSAVTSTSSGGPSLADHGLGTDASDIEEQELLSPYPELSGASRELADQHLESTTKPKCVIKKSPGEPSKQPSSEHLKSGTLSPNIAGDEAVASEISDSSRSTVIERAVLQQASTGISTPRDISLSTRGYAFKKEGPSKSSDLVIGLTLTSKATQSMDEQKSQSGGALHAKNAIDGGELQTTAEPSATSPSARTSAPQKLHGQIELLQTERKNRSILPLLSANKASAKQAEKSEHQVCSGSPGGADAPCSLHVAASGAPPDRVPSGSCSSSSSGPPESSDTSTTDLTGETMVALHPAPVRARAHSDEVSKDRNGQEDPDAGEKDVHPSGMDRSKLTLKFEVPNRPTKGAKENADGGNITTPEILSPQSDSLGGGDSAGPGSGATTCSASISDQEVFSPGDDVPALEDEICEVADGSPYAPIARMSDEDLTVSEWQSESRSATADSAKNKKKDKELQIKDEVLEHTPSKDVEVKKESCQGVNGRELLTAVGSDDDITVSEWAKEGGRSDILSGLEDLNKEFKLDDRHVTRRRKKKQRVADCEDLEDDFEKQKSPEPENRTVKHGASDENEDIVNEASSDTGAPPGTNEITEVLPRKEGKKGEPKQPLHLTPEPQKFQGYGGSFAEKVLRRPSGSDGNGKRDSIYLKSLNINLQMLDFPSVRSSSPGSLGSCEELDQDHSKEETPVQPFTATLPKPSTQTRSKKSGDQRQQPRQLAIKPPTDDSATTTAATQPARPCLDPVTAMLMSRREASRKSVHEDIQNLPYFDSLSLAGDFDEFKTPEAGTPTDEHFSTPPTSRLTCPRPPSYTDPERERARREARERARLKSDEELGLSPCSYRRRYIKTPAFDELTLTDLLDPDDEDEAFNAIDDRSSLRSLSTAQNRLAQFEDDDDEDSITPVVSPMQSNEDLDQQDVFHSPVQPIVIPNLYEYIPSQSSRVVAARKSKPKPKRRLFSRNEDEERKSLTKRNILSFLGFNKNGGSDGPTSKERKESYNKEQAARSAEERSPSREKTFSRLRLSRLSKEKAAKKSGSNLPAPAASQERPTSVPSAAVPRKKPTANESKEQIKKHISLDNLKSQQIVLPAKSRSVEFDSMVPQASEEDSLSDHDDKAGTCSDTGDKKCKGLNQRRLERLTQKVQRQHELKRLRTAQEIQRRLEEIEVSLRALERRGVLIERALRGEDDEDEDLRTEEGELTQVLFGLMRQKNKLSREEQELLIRVKDLELENHHSKLQQEMRERMAVDDNQKSAHDIEKERQILNEMLDIVEKRDRLVAQMDQLRIREEKEDKELLCQMQAQELSSCRS
ncbi:F-actin-monooxygenase MICAL3-like isoform X1 [Ornithodoros turicata]|uniref:F-actin-monooxygenase MICAL3-like isoform X1 n=1 Tax=Ornithodoros turicata TaxID=34597 RepID=UPI003139C2CE